MKKIIKKNAVFAGSFDPFTLGHLDIVKQAATLFDKVWIVVAQNDAKQNMFSRDVRVKLIEESVLGICNVEVVSHIGLVVNCMQNLEANYLIRGVRSLSDFEYEQMMAWNNKNLNSSIETVLFLSKPEHIALSSSVVRELLLNGANRKMLAKYVPEKTISLLMNEYKKKGK